MCRGWALKSPSFKKRVLAKMNELSCICEMENNLSRKWSADDDLIGYTCL